MSLTDFVFPKKCLGCGRIGAYICPNCFSKIEIIEFPICPICQRQAVGGKTHPGCQTKYGLDGLIVAARFKGVVRNAIVKVKYKWSYDISGVLVDLLAKSLWRFNFVSDAILVSIPLHPRRKRWRGFNQAEILTGELCKKFGQRRMNLLQKVKVTKAQVGLTKKERKENINGAFSFKNEADRSLVMGKDFILVDDVFTSGATTSEAGKVLKRAGAKSVFVMTVALG